MRRVWLGLMLTGCVGGGGGAGGGADALPEDAGPADDGGAVRVNADAVSCGLPGYFDGACCTQADGTMGLCAPEGCTDGVGADFNGLCLALCSEQCIAAGALGPCCQLTAGVGRCEAGQCVGDAATEPSEMCAALAALPPSVGCGAPTPKIPLDGPCDDDAACETGDCHPDAGYCTQRCPPEVECPRWFVCADQQCVRSGRLGDACQDSGQCQSGLCVRVAGVDGAYCTVQCDAETACPEPLACDLAQEVCLTPQPQ